MLKNLTFLLLCVTFVWAAKPMESLSNYNVILVHGAADKWSGLDCVGDNAIKEPYLTIIDTIKENNAIKIISNPTARIGGLVA